MILVVKNEYEGTEPLILDGDVICSWWGSLANAAAIHLLRPGAALFLPTVLDVLFLGSLLCYLLLLGFFLFGWVPGDYYLLFRLFSSWFLRGLLWLLFSCGLLRFFFDWRNFCFLWHFVSLWLACFILVLLLLFLARLSCSWVLNLESGPISFGFVQFLICRLLLAFVRRSYP